MWCCIDFLILLFMESKPNYTPSEVAEIVLAYHDMITAYRKLPGDSRGEAKLTFLSTEYLKFLDKIPNNVRIDLNLVRGLEALIRIKSK